MMLLRKVLLLILLLTVAPLYGATLDSLDAKLDLILQALKVVPPPPPIVTPPPPPPPPGSCPVSVGGKFTVGDKVTVMASTGGMNIRALPDIDTMPLTPFQPIGSPAIVICVRLVAGAQWLELDFETGVDGWARETGFDKVGPIVVLPPPPPPPPPLPPIEPVVGASYYVSTTGDDVNPGSVTLPFKTLGKAVPLLKPGEMLIVRGGTYDTGGFVKVGNETIFNTGVSWTSPIMIHAAPGEIVRFVRDLPAGSLYTVAQVRAGVHAPTKAQCEYYATQVPGHFLPYPENCWAGGSDPHYLWLFQDDTQSTTGPLLDFTSNTSPIRFLEFKGVVWDGRGIAKSIISTSTMANRDPTAKEIRFIDSDIGYAAASCFTQPGTSDDDSKGVRNESNITVIDSKIHHCGIPFDPARKNPWAKYLHGLYGHIGGWWCIRCEIYENAGGGWEPDGHRNGLIDSYVHDNSCLGAQVGGGDGHVVMGNVFYNNGCGELQLLSGRGHIFQHNTIIAGPANRDLGLQMTFRDSLVADNIVTGFKVSIYSLQPWDKANVYRNNLIDGGHQIGAGTIAPVEIGTIKAAPMLDANFKPMPGSPAIGAATDGKNVGAK